jgi:hypothetical protein
MTCTEDLQRDVESELKNGPDSCRVGTNRCAEPFPYEVHSTIKVIGSGNSACFRLFAGDGTQEHNPVGVSGSHGLVQKDRAGSHSEFLNQKAVPRFSS